MDPATAAGPAPPVAPTVWAAAATSRVPDDAWEFHARKAANDAAYQGLDYVPYVSTMPVVAPGAGGDGGVVPKWAWKKKGGGGGGGGGGH